MTFHLPRRTWETTAPITRRRLLGATGTAVAATAGCPSLGPSSAERVREARSELARFEDVGTAIGEGYRTTATYVRTDDGSLGIPFIDHRAVELETTRPQLLFYHLTEDGTYELLAVEWMRPVSEVDEPPTMFGREFDGPLESNAPGIPTRYSLRAWLFRENPQGLFARYNQEVEPGSLVDDLASLRESLASYRVGERAIEAGYRNTETCVGTTEGGYGVPFVDPDQIEGGGTTPERPPILLYELLPNWTYSLAGAEWFEPVEASDAAPTLFGQPFHEPMDGHADATDQPLHVGLHAWLFRANPRGVFNTSNPTLQC